MNGTFDSLNFKQKCSTCTEKNFVTQSIEATFLVYLLNIFLTTLCIFTTKLHIEDIVEIISTISIYHFIWEVPGENMCIVPVFSQQ